jgi:uridine phosphorylase
LGTSKTTCDEGFLIVNNAFIPHHINATAEDFVGNNGIGRYVFLPGSDGRAKEISKRFSHVKIKTHPRGHHLYLGTLNLNGKKIEVASISSGMGCPSTEIIVHELYHLGVKRFLRIGTAGSLQPHLIKVGDIINVHASVRDEDTTRQYVPVEVPAVASLEFVSSCILAAEGLKLSDLLHTGTVHCKSSLYAREMAAGPRIIENQHYLEILTQSGVLATEMESATLFIQSQIYNYQQMQKGDGHSHRVLAGALLAIVGTMGQFEESALITHTIENGIHIAIETVKTLAGQELLS